MPMLMPTMQTIQPGFVEIDCLGTELGNLNIEMLKSYKAIILKNLSPFVTQEFVRFGSLFGPILPYQNGPIFSFSGEALDEVELHLDGISASHPKKVPWWLIFHVKKASPAENGGGFRVADAEQVIRFLPSEMLEFLRQTKLQFFGYFEEQIKSGRQDEFSFEISPIVKLQEKEILRVFLPSLGTRYLKDSKKVFQGASEKESNRILGEIRSALYHQDIIHRFNFTTNDVLILDNRRTFHGRERFDHPVVRVLERIQALAPDAEEYGMRL